MLRVALIGLAVLVTLVVIVTVVTAIGFALPRGHVSSRDDTFAAPPERVFGTLVDVERYPAWRSGVTRIEVVTREPALRWREHGNDTITFELQEQQAPLRIVTRIADPSLPFGGTWTYVLAPAGTGTRLTITEHGEVYNPIFRFMSRYVFGHTATIDAFLADLRRHLSAG